MKNHKLLGLLFKNPQGKLKNQKVINTIQGNKQK